MSDWKESLVDYFKDGIKDSRRPILGVEIEHFILDKTMKAVPYGGEKGIKAVLSEFMSLYPEAKGIYEGDLLGFSVPDFDITLEPASQLEISIRPVEEISRIKNIYDAFRRNLETVLNKYEYRIANAGCQPVSKVADLDLIPKRRYELMNAYFNNIGTGGMEMMRGSASMQISIDYRSEEDFKRKIQGAYYYSPILKLLMDNSISFQGKLLNEKLKRTDIWRRVDPNRCHAMPGLFSEDFGFGTYADFIGDLKPIFLKDKEELIPTGDKCVAELYAGRSLNDEEIAHLLSMSFPDVRLKHVLEIRIADSVTSPYAEGYCALVKGMLYSQEGLDLAQRKIKEAGFMEADLLKVEDEIMKNGWNAVIYGMPAKEAAEQLLEIAKENLSVEEMGYLDAFKNVIAYGGIPMVSEEAYKNLYCA
ncbi:MAG: hypothetical protein K5853_06010 [Lachnospiraceae bacterium]|nr:hypothetical protein [Lachnospiraceae bacterium]